MKSPILTTFQYPLSDEELALISADDDTRNKFTNYMTKCKAVTSISFGKYFGPYVWVSVDKWMNINSTMKEINLHITNYPDFD